MNTRILLPVLFAGLSACNHSDFKGSSAKLNPTITKYFTQDDYPAATTSHKQGHAGEPQNQKFEQGEWGMLDLLVVIDNSDSMKEEQANLSTKLKPLLSQIDKSNWQIAVVTTDAADGCQRALIKKTDADAEAKFQAAINAGTAGSGEERPFYQGVAALKADCAGSTKWVRPGSTVSVLIVSDEDNCHIGAGNDNSFGCRNQPDLEAKYAIDYLSSIRTLGKDARVYGLVWHPSQDASQCTTALKQAGKIAELIDASSGKFGSICDTDYTATLTAISSDIAQIVKYEFDLAQEPDQSTLVITADGKPWTKFELNDKHVKFTEPPPFGSKVEVAYKSGAAGDLSKDFALDKTPVAGSLKATVNGQDVDAAQLKIDAASKKVSFIDAPAERADVKFEYKEAVSLKSQFVVESKTVDLKSLAVTVNDVALPAAQVAYDATTATVTLTPAPAASAKIKIKFKDKT